MLFLQLLINGLVIGSIYALMSMSFSLILTVTKIWHFAHGGVYAIGAYVIYLGVVRGGLSLWVAVVIAIAVVGIIGYYIEKIAYRPLRDRKSPSLIFFMASLIINVLIQNLLALFFGTDSKALVEGSVSKGLTFGDVVISPWDISVILISWIIIALVLLVMKYTRYGQALTAIATNAEMAEIIGINAAKVYAIVIAIGSMLAIPAVALIGYKTGISPTMGINILVIAVVATIMGGLNSIKGAVISGMIIGILENVGIWKLDSEWQSAIVFGLLFIFIVLRPQGIFGQKLKSKGV
ncbi:MAG: braD [Bacilli bacterium]|jgi:branched-chain amino acid transport system permease protein|nr:braD [Bacilli bacterium]